MRTLSFSQKLWIPSVLALLCVAGLSTFNAWSQRDVRVEERRADLSNLVDAAVGIAREYEALARSGKLSVADAKNDALARLKNFRYGKDGYVTVTDSSATVIMHPFMPGSTGKNLDAFQDAKGVHVFREVAQIGKGSGAGFVHYDYPRPGSTVEEPKLMRVVHFGAWDWNISTGVYIDDIDTAFHRSLLHALGILAAVCAALAGVVLVINRGLLRELGGEPAYAAQIATRIAAGDLGVPVETRPGDSTSMLHAMHTMQAMLARTVGTIRGGSDSIASATSQIAAGNLDLSARTEEQASSLEQTAASMEELTATVRQTTANAHQANDYAAAATAVAKKGGDVVAQVIQTMAQIDASAGKIAEIIGVIDGIAFQTNILALNAAVEAARAGDQGRGFAVVATEVRNLAQRSAAAAKQIKDLIGDSSGKVQAGTRLVREAGQTMGEIVDSIASVSGKMQEIAAASAEQSIGIEQVNQAVGQMDEVTQQNAALVEEAAAAAASLQEQAARLTAAVAVFSVRRQGNAAAQEGVLTVPRNRKTPIERQGLLTAY
ncbi:methyl-accepting chemotaxis protein [Janthinobacterium sp.]|uniref:methyl-accepting chemotaxis protein n=1 Tax=Janthinobacterium sp. TaxID=1871054 RepID=UPI00289779F1|nr:methyl-accepting chemotaxis protein [Janthinobacterium sp.]